MTGSYVTLLLNKNVTSKVKKFSSLQQLMFSILEYVPLDLSFAIAFQRLQRLDLLLMPYLLHNFYKLLFEINFFRKKRNDEPSRHYTRKKIGVGWWKKIYLPSWQKLNLLIRTDLLFIVFKCYRLKRLRLFDMSFFRGDTTMKCRFRIIRAN